MWPRCPHPHARELCDTLGANTPWDGITEEMLPRASGTTLCTSPRSALYVNFMHAPLSALQRIISDGHEPAVAESKRFK